ncbi:Tropinesterase [Sphingomonas antarctica]|uniref:alpha/beta fold hydrolase n=1 Tax=Sphingomonas antarctica TaxID=2040274 RepID=UPI0039EBA50C
MGEAASDGYWQSTDGLRLHYRLYGRASEKAPVLCLPGLTRNARDYAALAAHLAHDRQVYAIDFRGRGGSDYAKDPATYMPMTYAADVEALLTDREIGTFIAIGTSLGGIVSLILGAARPERLAGLVLNDVGPVIDAAGLDRIRSYVGKSATWPTWVHAARDIGGTNAASYPQFELPDWIAMAKRVCRLKSSGRIVFDYDMAIAEPLRAPGGEAGVDLWPLFEAVRAVQTLYLRGALSDILSVATLDEMIRRGGGAAVTVPGVGHAPTLDEPEARAAIDALIARAA